MNNARQQGAPAFIWAIVGVFVAVQVVMELIAAGYLGTAATYRDIYFHYAFNDPIFEAWRAGEDVPLDLLLPPFVTYAFLHGGLLHLAMNSVIFLALGGRILRVVGPVKFCVIFVGSAIAGAVAFALLAEARGPMIGASGVVFGLFGVVKQWEWRYIRLTGAPANRFWGTIIALTLINAAFALLPVLMGGLGAAGSTLAWQTHLGGFIGGWALANILTPRHAGPSPI